jgi:hypothetical protein
MKRKPTFICAILFLCSSACDIEFCIGCSKWNHQICINKKILHVSTAVPDKN